MGYTFKTFTSEVLTVDDLNAQFAKIENKLGNIKNSDISTDARITSNKLLDRFAVSYQTVTLHPTTWGGTFVFQDTSTVASAAEARIYPILPAKRAYLVGINTYVTGFVANTLNGSIAYTYNGVTFFTDTITATGLYTVKSGDESSSFNTPIISLTDGDYIGLRFLRTGGTGGTTSATAITVSLAYKIELTA